MDELWRNPNSTPISALDAQVSSVRQKQGGGDEGEVETGSLGKGRSPQSASLVSVSVTVHRGQG